MIIPVIRDNLLLINVVNEQFSLVFFPLSTVYFLNKTENIFFVFLSNSMFVCFETFMKKLEEPEKAVETFTYMAHVCQAALQT